jgi:nucleotide-binding universal stress UspA family protein
VIRAGTARAQWAIGGREPAFVVSVPLRSEAVISLKNILVATDFGDPAASALVYGRQLARTFGATLHVVHVVEDISGRLSGLPNAPEAYIDFGRWQREAVAASQEQADRLLTDEDRQQLGARAVALLARSESHAILEYAREHDIDLIVAGTHGRGVVAHLVMGSIAERLVRLADCPVLVVRHPEREFVLPDALQAVAKHA